MNNIKTYQLSNGLRIAITKNVKSESVAVSIMIRVGSIYEDEFVYGGAHLLEHLLFKATKQHPGKSELSKKLEDEYK